ncbi:TadE/TadG family type IV pilus assembly protein [Aureimonas phyllosphaerae]|uniref:TadE/TadG family type IV pilus assembly protein n=1 Tax=Aureimonas phyllosphaerae TaxID=1166078 RepID=UPI003A5C3FFD
MRLRREEDGTAAIEFAIILPVMLVLLLGTFEISRYIYASNQIVHAVSMVGQMASQLPASAKASDVQRIWSAAPLIAPEAGAVARRLGRSVWSDALTVTISNIAFDKSDAACQTDCQYQASVAWSVGQSPLACGTISQGQKLPPTDAIIPTEFFGDGSVILVQAALPYVPQLEGTAGFLDGVARNLTTTLSESSWFLPRNAKRIALSPSAGGGPRSNICPG